MKRLLLTAGFILLLPLHAWSGQNWDRLIVVRPDYPIELSLSRKTLKLKEKDERSSRLMALVYWMPELEPDTLQLARRNEDYSVTFEVPDQNLRAFMITLQLQDTVSQKVKWLKYQNQYTLDVVVGSDSNHLERDAWHQLAAFYASAFAPCPYDMKKADEALNNELEAYPDNFNARLTRHEYWHKAHESPWLEEAISKDIESALADFGDSPEVYTFAIRAWQTIGQPERAMDAAAKLTRRFPRSELALRLQVQNIVQSDSTRQRLELLKTLLSDPLPLSVEEHVLNRLIDLSMAYDEFRDLVPQGMHLKNIVHSFEGIRTLSALAAFLSTDIIHQSEALEMTEAGLSALDELFNDQPPWQQKALTEEFSRLKSDLHYITGSICSARGNLTAALHEFETAASTSSLGHYYHAYGLCLEALNRPEEAVIQLARAAAFSTTAGDSAYSDFRRLCAQLGKSLTGQDMLLDEAYDWVDQRFVDAVLAKGQNQPCPDWDFEDEYGYMVRLSDQFNSVQLLCFWSPGSQASLYAMGLLHQLYEEWGEDVLFMSIETKLPGKPQQTEKSGLTPHFTALKDADGSGASMLGVKGLPTILLLDTQGRIRFHHQGFSSSLLEALAIEMDWLLSEPEE